MKTNFRANLTTNLLWLATAVSLTFLLHFSTLSAQPYERRGHDKPHQVVGTWYGEINSPGSLGVPLVQTFHSDRTTTAIQIDSFGVGGTFKSAPHGAWTRTGRSTFRMRLINLVSDLSGMPAVIVQLIGEGEISRDGNVMTITVTPEVFLCSPSSQQPGYTCPDPSTDTPDLVLSDTYPELRRVVP